MNGERRTRPQLELRIRTAKGETSWWVLVENDKLRVAIPNCCDALWKQPIVETRGGRVEFNARNLAKELGERLGLEFCIWAARLSLDLA
jgi:hypothetical protein